MPELHSKQRGVIFMAHSVGYTRYRVVIRVLQYIYPPKYP